MSSPFQEVPVLPVVIPLGVLIFALLLLHLRGRGLFSVPRVAVAAAVAVYAAGITANTVFPIFLNKPERPGSWEPGLALIPFVDYELYDAVMNMAVFLPLGMLVPLMLRGPVWWKVLVGIGASSLTIELTQLAAQAFLAGGHIADINDFLFNVLGGATGYGLFRLMVRIPVLSAIINRFRWSKPSHDEPALRTLA